LAAETSKSTSSAEEQARFLKNLQLLLADGEYVSTYKFALLLALKRWAIEHPLHDERIAIDAADLAPYFVELYWPQIVPFRVRPSDAAGTSQAAAPREGWPGWKGVLVQERGKQAPRVLSLISEARRRLGSDLRKLTPQELQRLCGAIARSIVDMPLWKLQRVRTSDEPLHFLYRQGATKRQVRFERGVIPCLVAFAPLVEDLVRSAWLRFVIRCNGSLLPESAELEGFLFPDGRASLDVWRPALRDVQGDQCFYCNGRLQNAGVVDHFLPWARYPRDLGQNFVLAHSTCNGAKSDHLAAEEHLQRWCARNTERSAELVAHFADDGLPQHWPTLWSAAWSLYSNAADAGASGWVKSTQFALLGPDWRRILEDHRPAA